MLTDHDSSGAGVSVGNADIEKHPRVRVTVMLLVNPAGQRGKPNRTAEHIQHVQILRKNSDSRYAQLHFA